MFAAIAYRKYICQTTSATAVINYFLKLSKFLSITISLSQQKAGLNTFKLNQMESLSKSQTALGFALEKKDTDKFDMIFNIFFTSKLFCISLLKKESRAVNSAVLLIAKILANGLPFILAISLNFMQVEIC